MTTPAKALATIERRSGRIKRLGWRGYASMLRMMQIHPRTVAELCEIFGVTVNTCRKIMARMRALRLVHIIGWVKPGVRACHVPVYAFGDGVDVARPDGRPGNEPGPLTRYTALPELTQVAHFIRLLAEPISKTEIARATGSQWSNVGNFIEHCHEIRLVRIVDWQQRLYGGLPAALYAIGSGPDAARPRPQPRREIERRRRRARSQRLQMQRLIQATAANLNDAREAA